MNCLSFASTAFGCCWRQPAGISNKSDGIDAVSIDVVSIWKDTMRTLSDGAAVALLVAEVPEPEPTALAAALPAALLAALVAASAV